jgi:agmatine deiminase
MVTRFLLCAVLAATTAFFAAGPVFGQPAKPPRHFVAPGEFEPQEYIWLSWVEQAWLGGAPFTGVTLDVMRAITPHVRVRLMYSAFTSDDASMFREPFIRSPAAAEDILRKRLQSEGVDLSRVDLFYYPLPVGAIQDPGPYFLRSADGRLALADYGFDHPDPRMEAIDREIAAKLALPTVSSPIASEGGGQRPRDPAARRSGRTGSQSRQIAG